MYARSLLRTPCLDTEWRYHWFATLALLRSVGYVLKKIDCQTSVKHKTVIEGEFKRLQDTKPAPEIFWQFIDSERHLVVKEYLFPDSIARGVGVSSVSYTDPETGRHETVHFGKSTSFEIYSSCIHGGHFDGKPKLDVVNEAIDWWTAYLNILESRIKGP